MGANSSIEWTDHTFNPWWGCVKVSPGCQHCYAETLSKRFGNNIWGPAKTTSRRTFGPKHWAEPLKWDAEAAKLGQRKRVFCASMADVFEDHPMLEAERAKLWIMIEATPNLDWLLLTKRPENINSMVPWHGETGLYHGWPANVWVGTSVENQDQAEKRIPYLLDVPARVRFLSCEPLLGPVDLTDGALYTRIGGAISYIDWVIAGGESGPGARPMHPDWARGLRDQCQAAGVAYLFKQWGQFMPAVGLTEDGDIYAPPADNDRSVDPFGDRTYMLSLGKHAAGRLLDGRTWDELPS